MNDAFHDEIRWLPPEWNLMTYNLKASNFTIDQIDSFYGVS